MPADTVIINAEEDWKSALQSPPEIGPEETCQQQILRSDPAPACSRDIQMRGHTKSSSQIPNRHSSTENAANPTAAQKQVRRSSAARIGNNDATTDCEHHHVILADCCWNVTRKTAFICKPRLVTVPHGGNLDALGAVATSWWLRFQQRPRATLDPQGLALAGLNTRIAKRYRGRAVSCRKDFKEANRIPVDLGKIVAARGFY